MIFTHQRKEKDVYGPGTPCSYCGKEIDQYSPEWTEYCMRHSVKRINPLLHDLKVLVEKYE